MKLNRRMIRSLIKEELRIITESSSELGTLKSKEAQIIQQMNDHAMEMGGENRAYAHGYMNMFQQELSDVQLKIRQLAPRPEQLELSLKNTDGIEADPNDDFMEYLRMADRNPDADRR